MTKPRVLYLVHEYPQISQTYIRSEIEAVSEDCDLKVIGLTKADIAYKNPMPFLRTDDPVAIREALDAFRPDVLHGHWLYQAPTLAYFAGYFQEGGASRPVPFTVRAHSFDTLGAPPAFLRSVAPLINSDLCLGLFTFPFTRPLLEKAGIHADKIRDCYPVINYRRFHDRTPNGSAVMNVGACLPKKEMGDFVELARRVPGRQFSLYAMGYEVAAMARLNAAAGDPVRIVPPVDPDEMPAEYKQHEWLVYTAARGMNTVGWPMAVAEAQAAGVGVCMPNLRADLRDYVGPAGFLYDSLSEVVDIVSRPLPSDLRELGFEHARRSDIARHKVELVELWGRARGLPSKSARQRPPSAGFDWGKVGINWEWSERLHAALRTLESRIPHDAPYLLIDDGAFSGRLPSRSRARAFPERDGQYWGPPTDDKAAIDELVRQRCTGAEHVVFTWPAFWWLDHYTGFANYVRSHSRSVARDDNLLIFELTGSE